MKYSLLIFLICVGFIPSGKETIRFKSQDGLEIVGDLYMKHPTTAPFIVLFHQANWSRGEYLEIAPRLNSMGFNCLAVDLRSGGAINDVQNITRQNALKAMKETQYVDALPDMTAAINYADQNFAEGKLIVWGSSYSAALALKLTGDMPDKVDAVLAFSPGEYFASQGRSRDYITSSAINVSQPAFITSSRDEKNNWWGIYVTIPSDKKQYYLPETAGNHGSRALWSRYPDSKGYWEAVTQFLSSF
ncbi:alpha/beta hydrolase [Fulvivirga imtechensis]|nr:alpha/beta hydrolase [Fulvivirga imtechensis]